MRLAELLGVTGACPPHGTTLAEAEVHGVTADSRAVTPGLLFAALPGSRADGRAFIPAAEAAGAAAILAPEGTPAGRAPMLWAADPRRALALAAAALAGPQPGCVVAVTGTNGKTSTVDFLRQLWTLAGLKAASIGTLGLVAEGFPPGPSLTTPDPVALHAMLAALARAGVTHVAMEASSHGLDQRRLDGVRLAAAGFTNLSRDHLDYHGDMAGYRAAKLRLFDALLPAGAAAVVNADMDTATLGALRARPGLLTVGEAGEALRLLRQQPRSDGQALDIAVQGEAQALHLPLVGRFQADNALLALGLAMACGMPAAQGLALLPQLKPVRGRLELAATLANGAAVYVDYAHTPDGLRTLLRSLRPHATGRLLVVFGAGGDRDPGKRPLMGAACTEVADRCFVTDDNPRSENPAVIRAAVLAGCAGGLDAGDRRHAIALAMAELRPGDVLAVAGKGHEAGQTIGAVTYPFDDVAVVRELARP